MFGLNMAGSLVATTSLLGVLLLFGFGFGFFSCPGFYYYNNGVAGMDLGLGFLFNWTQELSLSFLNCQLLITVGQLPNSFQKSVY